MAGLGPPKGWLDMEAAKFCGNCGSALAEAARFCGECGTPRAAPTGPGVAQSEAPAATPAQPPAPVEPAAPDPPEPSALAEAEAAAADAVRRELQEAGYGDGGPVQSAGDRKWEIRIRFPPERAIREAYEFTRRFGDGASPGPLQGTSFEVSFPKKGLFGVSRPKTSATLTVTPTGDGSSLIVLEHSQTPILGGGGLHGREMENGHWEAFANLLFAAVTSVWTAETEGGEGEAPAQAAAPAAQAPPMAAGVPAGHEADPVGKIIDAYHADVKKAEGEDWQKRTVLTGIVVWMAGAMVAIAAPVVGGVIAVTGPLIIVGVRLARGPIHLETGPGQAAKWFLLVFALFAGVGGLIFLFFLPLVGLAFFALAAFWWQASKFVTGQRSIFKRNPPPFDAGPGQDAS